MKRSGILVLVLGLVAGVAASGNAAAQSGDPFQRFIRIHNLLDQTIYPVIQSPQDKADKPNSKPANCGTGGNLRIIVNDGKEGAGIAKGGTVTVKIPKDKPCDIGGFYDASRIYIMVTPFDQFETLLNDQQKTTRYPSWDYVNYNPCAGCFVGLSNADYGHDAPGQLLEYTMISQNPADGNKFPDPNNSNGTPVLDFDVSYVDDAYLPVAMAIDDTGATQFMGSTLPYGTFNQRMTSFLTDGDWSRYAAYNPSNWADSSDCVGGVPKDPNKTRFSCLTTRTDRVPSASILITDAQTGGTSNFFFPAWDGKTPRECNAALTSDPSANLKCSTPRPNGDGLTSGKCCPNENTPPAMLGCCDQDRFLIDRTLRKYIVASNSFQFSNETLQHAVDNFNRWQGAGSNPCKDPGGEAMTTAPVVAADKGYFCSAFKRTVDFVWKEFLPQCSKHGTAQDRCVTAAIIGYDLKNSSFDPELCKKCPNPDEGICPRSCALEQQRNESVQALQRGLPWTAAGDPATCAACPDAVACSSTCIQTPVYNPNAKLYHRDKYLHFWANYKSIYNLNPFARFVHNPDNGLAAPGAYSFSIDDFYGNFGGPGSTMLIDVGCTVQNDNTCTNSLPNKEPFDPYKQYVAGMGTGWDHVRVCGRFKKLPPGTPSNVGYSAPFSFWNNGVPQASCEIRLYAAADETKYIAYQVKEVPVTVKDNLTGLTHQAYGLSGVFANRFPGDVPVDDPYCSDKSTDKDLVSKGLCRGNLSSGKLNLDYVGVSDDACKGKPTDAQCGKPLVTINTPSLK